ncbi:hypothetical protein [Aquimarina algicola]|uniref:DUF3823 domain-containing protein n=1 Tax=Aquimarina algicola TaxID=2589995 RepID=A0A504J2R0_9FLAO|nr:hypothetical protein [Aquimarina algicola]TPN85147.1 hypothetical protein FHK87_14035 [Aquimarina algicola]
MNYLKNIFIFLLVTGIFFSCDNDNETLEESSITKNQLVYNVRFGSLNATPSNDPGGIQGYYATNQNTGKTYYSERVGEYAYDNKIENLPAGTYEFGAIEGYWEGASSEVITLRQDLVGEDGFVYIQLQYWSE